MYGNNRLPLSFRNCIKDKKKKKGRLVTFQASCVLFSHVVSVTLDFFPS